MDFSELIGFKNQFKILIDRFIQKKVSNSLIFYGNEGIGKRTFTYSLINALYKHSNDNSSFHNTKNLIYNNSHPNIKYVTKTFDQKTNKFKNFISIEQIRETSNFVNKSSINNNYKFVIIDSADYLNINSSNSLLKILEEPNKSTFLILITHNLSSLLPTIVSRCIKFKFENPSFNEFEEILLNNHIDVNKSKLNFLYDITNSSPGLAMRFIEHDIFETFDSIINILSNQKNLSSEIVDFSNIVGNYNNDQYRIFLNIFRFILINITKINLGIDITKDYISNLSIILSDISNKINNNNILNTLEYLNMNEKTLYVYNLDKKIFSLNIFSTLNNAK